MTKPELTIGGKSVPSGRRGVVLFGLMCALYLAWTAAVVYVYAFVLPQHVGFETTLLLGVALLFLATGD